MASQQPKPPAAQPTGKPDGTGNLISRAIAAAAGAALGALVAIWFGPAPVAPPQTTWAGNWFSPLCAGLGAILGIAVDYYLLSGKDGGAPS